MVLTGIVTFNPNIIRLQENIDAINSQVNRIVIVDNHSTNITEIKRLVSTYTNVKLICFSENLGIATALNRIGDEAVKGNFDYFITFDQDSVVLPGLVDEYKKYLDLPNLGLLNSYYTDRNHIFDKFKHQVVVESPLLITAGTFMKTELFAKGFRYQDNLFIDRVDFDICIALIEAGYKNYQIPYHGFIQEIGSITNHRFLGIKTYTYNLAPLRRYYNARNLIILLKKYGFNKIMRNQIYEDFIREMKTLFLEKEKLEKTKMIIKGTFDGFKVKQHRIRNH